MIAPPQLQPGQSGQAAPASDGKPQLGAAAPASNGTPAGTPSSPSSADAALVEAKKQAEHWRKKYERDIGNVESRFAKLEGLVQGLSATQPHAPKPVPRTVADLDEPAIEDVLKRGIEGGEPGLVTESVREIARRAADAARKEAKAEAEAHVGQVLATRQVYAEIAQKYGQDALNEQSPLRERVDAYLAQTDQKAIEKNPRLLSFIFAQADQDLRTGERGELERLRDAESKRLAREELERSNQTIAKRAKQDVAEALGRGDIKEAIRQRLPWARG